MGLSPAVVDEMTPYEVGCAYEARRAYDSVMFFRPMYDSSRMNAFLTMLPHVKKNTLKSPADLWEFSHEKSASDNPVDAPLTEEEKKALLAKLDQ